ncbi:MAG: T9SS type A sorting domain-containing protein [Bacteroidetes bacterium]|nr:T9SS type A sorting domain-containing protein [Bacteroidota bacterium]
MKLLKITILAVLIPLVFSGQDLKKTINDSTINQAVSLESIGNYLYLNIQQGEYIPRHRPSQLLVKLDNSLVVQKQLDLIPILDSLYLDSTSLMWDQVQMSATVQGQLLILVNHTKRILPFRPRPCGFTKPFLLVFDADLNLQSSFDLGLNSDANLYLNYFDSMGNEVLFSGHYELCGSQIGRRPFLLKLDLATGELKENRSLQDSLQRYAYSFSQPTITNSGLYTRLTPDYLMDGARLLKVDSALEYKKVFSLKDSTISSSFSHYGRQKIISKGNDSLFVLGTSRDLVASNLYSWTISSSLFIQGQKSRIDTLPFCGIKSSFNISSSNYDHPELAPDAVDAQDLDSVFIAQTTGTTFNYTARDSMELYLYNLNLETGQLNWRTNFKWPKTISNVSVQKLGRSWVLCFMDQDYDGWNSPTVRIHLWLFDEQGTLLDQEYIEMKDDATMIFPNPVQSIIRLTEIEGLQNADFIIYNVNGKCVKSGQINLGEGIDVSDLESGVYILKVGKKEIQRFVKN